MLTKEEKLNEELEIMRHSCAHVLAAAVQELWPDVKFAIGPAIENGFYYDFDFGDVKIGEDDLKKIEKKMKHIIKQNLEFEKRELGIEKAIEFEKERKANYKIDILEDLKKDGKKNVSYYWSGNFGDLCIGKHLGSTGKIKLDVFKLTKIAGAYWRGDEKTYTSSLGSKQLYEISGHWAHYKDDMFITEADESPYALRPMTCPHQFCIFQAKPRSYKELPIRYSETSTLFRNELSGELSGLIRVRQFTISEGHLICRADQVEEEILGVLNLIEYILKTLGLNNYTYRFSKWDRENKKGKYVNNPEAWNKTQESMKKILDKAGVEYTEADGEAAFYGPKLDVQYKNVNGKEDTIITVQVDFAMSGRFGLKYTDSNGKEAEPVVIHRTSLGCYERTLAYLIEHYAGAFPVWLSPVQVKLVAVSAKHVEYCTKQAQELMGAGIRVEVDFSDETVGNKIRKAVAEKVPYMLVIGDREMESEKLNVRDRGAEDIREIGKDEFIKEILEKINSKL